MQAGMHAGAAPWMGDMQMGANPAHPAPAPPGPSQPLTMVAPANAFSGEAGRYPWYRVAFAGGVDLRHGPSVEAPRTGETLCQNATLAVAEEILGADGRVYLRLADGRGWAFDDSALFPHDPSVVRGYWQPVSVVPPGANAAAVAAAVANGTAGGGGGAMTDVAGSMGSMKQPTDYGNQNSQGRGVNPWILN
mmetsp:Transcript_103423/g.126371  ORF Transcript_103423/g.126371 Transcript_103423/m.126371 type:complete len:192 (-) Transcript_103423:188-763(-)